MARRLNAYVYIDEVAYGPDSVIPEEIAARITNPKVWVDDDDTPLVVPGVQETAAPAGPARPAGELPTEDWTVKELREYAKAHEVTLGEAKAKDQILAVLAENGHGTPVAAEIPETPAESAALADEDPADEDSEES